MEENGKIKIVEKMKVYEEWKKHTPVLYSFISSMAFTWPLSSVFLIKSNLDNENFEDDERTSKLLRAKVILTATTKTNSFHSIAEISYSCSERYKILDENDRDYDFDSFVPRFKEKFQYWEGKLVVASDYLRLENSISIGDYRDDGIISLHSLDTESDSLNCVASFNDDINEDVKGGFGIKLTKEKLFTSDQDGIVKYFSIPKHKCLYNQKIDDIAIDSLCVENDSLFYFGDDNGVVRRHDVREGSNSQIAKEKSAITCLYYHPDIANTLLIGNQVGDIKFFDPRKDKVLRTLGFHTQEVVKLKWNSINKTLISCSKDSKVCLWRPFGKGTGKNKPSFLHSGHTECVNDAIWIDDESIFSVDEDNICQVWSPG